MATNAKSAALLADCVLAAAVPGACGWCGGALPGRRRSWCSDVCSDAFWTNHWWSLARAAVKRRDKYRCVRCGERAPKRPSRKGCANDAAYRAALSLWRLAKKTKRVEVNHIAPAAGRHRTLSCVHHLSNLETLCRACHAEITARQARAARRRDATTASDGGV